MCRYIYIYILSLYDTKQYYKNTFWNNSIFSSDFLGTWDSMRFDKQSTTLSGFHHLRDDSPNLLMILGSQTRIKQEEHIPPNKTNSSPGWFQGLPRTWDPRSWEATPKLFPYHSHIFKDSNMGVVWEVPLLGVPENPTDVGLLLCRTVSIHNLLFLVLSMVIMILSCSFIFIMINFIKQLQR